MPNATSGRWQFDAALGIVGVADGRFLIGQNTFARGGDYEGRVALARPDTGKGLVFEHPGETTPVSAKP
jgi:hypothetical protein